MSDVCQVQVEGSGQPCNRPVKFRNTDGTEVCGYHKDETASPIGLPEPPPSPAQADVGETAPEAPESPPPGTKPYRALDGSIVWR